MPLLSVLEEFRATVHELRTGVRERKQATDAARREFDEQAARSRKTIEATQRTLNRLRGKEYE